MQPPEHCNDRTHGHQPPAGVAPPPLRNQQQQGERTAASSTGRGRQLDPEAGGAMEALAARAAAAAAAEARASGSVAAAAARITPPPASSTAPAAFNTPLGRPTHAKCHNLAQKSGWEEGVYSFRWVEIGMRACGVVNKRLADLQTGNCFGPT